MARQAEQLSLFEAEPGASRLNSPATQAPRPQRVARPGRRNPAQTQAAGPAAAADRGSRKLADADDPLAVLAGYLSQLAAGERRRLSGSELRQARNDWLRRLEAGRRSTSSLTAYRIAIDDLLDWS